MSFILYMSKYPAILQAGVIVVYCLTDRYSGDNLTVANDRYSIVIHSGILTNKPLQKNMQNLSPTQRRVKNNRIIELDNRTVAVYDKNNILLNKKTFDDCLKAMIVFKTL